MSGHSRAKVRFALVGCGRMGRHHSEKMIADGRAEVVALFDAQRSTADRLQTEMWPGAFVAPDFNELLARDNLDAAIICTPTAEHYPQAVSCLDRGWHVLCEKPLASNRAQILELIELSKKYREKQQVFSLGYQRRYTSLFRTLRREVRSGKWGKVRAIMSHCVENWQSTIGGTWRDNPRQNAGGYVTDAGSHKIDAVFYVTGLAPLEVYARSHKAGSHVEIVSSVSALLTDGVFVTMDFIGHAQYLGEDLCIHCERADLILRQDELWIGRNGQQLRLPADEPDSSPVSGLLDVILSKAEDLSPPDAALPVFDMTQAILASSQSGLPVNLAESQDLGGLR